VSARVLTFALVAAALVPSAPLMAQVDDTDLYTYFSFDELEIRGGDANPIRWDAEGWIGGDFNKLWVKTEGEQFTASNEGEGEAELQVLFSRLATAFWDFQFGVRVDGVYGGDVDRARGLLVVGVEGLAPYWFDVEAAAFVSHEGDVSFRTTSTYDLFVSQRLIFQPRLEVNVAIQDVPEFGVGSGLNEVDLGWRLRYEVRRKFAPYVGTAWARRIGDTADLARDVGRSVSDFSVVGGVRIWF